MLLHLEFGKHERALSSERLRKISTLEAHACELLLAQHLRELRLCERVALLLLRLHLASLDHARLLGLAGAKSGKACRLRACDACLTASRANGRLSALHGLRPCGLGGHV